MPNKFTPIDKCLICLCRLHEENTNFNTDLCDPCYEAESKKEQPADNIDNDDDWLGI